MKRSLVSLDLLGHSIRFSVDGREKYQTILGGIFSFCAFAVSLAFSIIFAIDFFSKNNSKIVVDNQLFTDGIKVNLTNKTFNYGYRIVNVGSGGDKVDDKMYHMVSFVQFSKPNKYNIITTNATKCNNNSNPLAASKVDKFSEFYCVDLDNKDMTGAFLGGDRSYSFYNYLFISLQRCNDDNKCFNKSAIQSISENPNNSFSFEFFYSETFYTGVEGDALATEMTIRRIPIDLKLVRNDFVFMESTRLDDDVGWIVENKQTYMKTSVKSRESYFISNSASDMYDQFAAIIIRMNNIQPVFKRSYLKIQDLAALIVGFSRMIFFIAECFVFHFNIYSRKLLLFNTLFEEKPVRDHQRVKSVVPLIADNFNSERANLDIIKQNAEAKIEFQKLNNEPVDLIQADKPSNLNQPSKEKEGTISLNFFSFLKSHLGLGKCCESKEVEYYEKMDQYINSRLDIQNFLRTMAVFEKLRAILLNPDQNIAIDHIKLINIADPRELNLLVKNDDKIEQFKRIQSYFADKLKDGNIKKKDEKIYSMLELDIKPLVIEPEQKKINQ